MESNNEEKSKTVGLIISALVAKGYAMLVDVSGEPGELHAIAHGKDMGNYYVGRGNSVYDALSALYKIVNEETLDDHAPF